jgi:aspartokinase
MVEQSKTVEIIRRIGAPEPEKISITGILKSQELSLIMLTLPASEDPPAGVLSLLGAHGVNIRFITLYDDSPETRLLALCVETESLPGSLHLLGSHQASLGIHSLSHHPRVRIISVYPYKERAQLAERLLTSLRLSGVDPLAVNNASSVLSCVLSSGELQKALACLDHIFELP